MARSRSTSSWLADAGLHIRPARAEDAEAISQLIIASITQLCATDHKNDAETIARWVSNKTPTHIRALIETGECAFIAEIAQTPTGVVFATAGEITLLFTAPAFLGRGVGAALLSTAERWMATQGTREIHLESSLTAAPFYRHHGWTDLGILPGSFDMPGHRMRKQF